MSNSDIFPLSSLPEILDVIKNMLSHAQMQKVQWQRALTNNLVGFNETRLTQLVWHHEKQKQVAISCLKQIEYWQGKSLSVTQVACLQALQARANALLQVNESVLTSVNKTLSEKEIERED